MDYMFNRWKPKHKDINKLKVKDGKKIAIQTLSNIKLI